jgi:hypothetical protein
MRWECEIIINIGIQQIEGEEEDREEDWSNRERD